MRCFLKIASRSAIDVTRHNLEVISVWESHPMFFAHILYHPHLSYWVEPCCAFHARPYIGPSHVVRFTHALILGQAMLCVSRIPSSPGRQIVRF